MGQCRAKDAFCGGPARREITPADPRRTRRLSCGQSSTRPIDTRREPSTFARKLFRAVDANRLNRELNALQQPKVLVIDEIGCLPFDAAQASLLFQVICRRYQRNQPIILTSNKAFGEWGQVFGEDPVMASAALDRLLHRSTILNIRGESYRLREKRQAGLANLALRVGQTQTIAT